MKHFSILPLVFVFVLNSMLVADGKREPRYENVSLSYWIGCLKRAKSVPEYINAFEGIKNFGSEAAPAVPLLVPMLDDRSESFREMVTEVLCAIGPGVRSAAPQLIQSLHEGTAYDPSSVIKVLAKIESEYDKAMPAIRQTIYYVRKKQGAETASYLIIQLDEFGETAVPLLMEFLDDNSTVFICRAADEINQLAAVAKQAIPKLKALLKHDERDVVISAGFALEKFGKAAIPEFEALLEHSDRIVRNFAAAALLRLDEDHKEAKVVLEKEWERFWLIDPPSPLTPYRLHGGIQ